LNLNIASITNIDPSAETAQKTGGEGISPPKPSFYDTLLGYLPSSKGKIADEIRAHSREKRIMLNDLLEQLRLESDKRRQELLISLLREDDDKDNYDVFGKCLDIARRIMRGEKVSPEEMRLLAQNFPELLFQALLLREEKTESDREKEQEPGKNAGASDVDKAYADKANETYVLLENAFFR